MTDPKVVRRRVSTSAGRGQRAEGRGHGRRLACDAAIQIHVCHASQAASLNPRASALCDRAPAKVALHARTLPSCALTASARQAAARVAHEQVWRVRPPHKVGKPAKRRGARCRQALAQQEWQSLGLQGASRHRLCRADAPSRLACNLLQLGRSAAKRCTRPYVPWGELSRSPPACTSIQRLHGAAGTPHPYRSMRVQQ